MMPLMTSLIIFTKKSWTCKLSIKVSPIIVSSSPDDSYIIPRWLPLVDTDMWWDQASEFYLIQLVNYINPESQRQITRKTSTPIAT